MSFEAHFQLEADHITASLKEEIKSLRTGTANPGLVENLVIDAYGDGSGGIPLIELASIAIGDAMSLLIQPWDKTIIKNIEKGILVADLGFRTSNEGERIRVTLPSLTEDQRREYVKILKGKLEDARIKVRGAREKEREDAIKAEKQKIIGEDEKFRRFKKIDELTKEYMGAIEEIGARKEKEIMSLS